MKWWQRLLDLFFLAVYACFWAIILYCLWECALVFADLQIAALCLTVWVLILLHLWWPKW